MISILSNLHPLIRHCWDSYGCIVWSVPVVSASKNGLPPVWRLAIWSWESTKNPCVHVWQREKKWPVVHCKQQMCCETENLEKRKCYPMTLQTGARKRSNIGTVFRHSTVPQGQPFIVCLCVYVHPSVVSTSGTRTSASFNPHTHLRGRRGRGKCSQRQTHRCLRWSW